MLRNSPTPLGSCSSKIKHHSTSSLFFGALPVYRDNLHMGKPSTDLGKP